MPFSIAPVSFKGAEALRLDSGRGAAVVIGLRGGQVLSWQTADGRERLYLSEQAVFDGSRPVRGGIPVCFPQFAALGPLPKHGLLRTRMWLPAERNCRGDYAVMTFAVEDDAASRALWPHAFRAEVSVAVEGKTLELSARELAILEIMLQRMGRVVSKQHITERLSSWDTEVSFNAIDIAMHRLRKKLENSQVAIRTLRGLGYLLEKSE